jgi:putative ABC transport system ATP-binding protein
MNEPIISCQNLQKSFKSQDIEVEVIRDTTLEVHEGEFTVLMGSSGSGKSTLLYLLSGLETVSGGQIWFDGQEISNLKEKSLSLLRRKGMGFVFQAFNLIPNLSLLENILAAGYLGDAPKKQVEERARELLETMGLGKLADRLPAQVSGGEQQRAATARALINSPQVLFADEPTGALNSAAGMRVLEYFGEISKQNQTIFMVTHDLRAACSGDRVLFMRDGLIQGDYRFPAESRTFEQREEALFAWLTEQGW